MASPVAALLISPIRSVHSTPSRRRQLTPSIEASLSKRSLVLTTLQNRPANLEIGSQIPVQPFFAPKQLFPGGTASVQGAAEYSHAGQQPVQTLPAVVQHVSRHVLLPFDLRDPAVDLDADEVRQVLYNIFPATANVNPGRNRSYFNFQLDSLPQSPWPLTVGGLPITISAGNKGKGTLFPKQTLSPSRMNICQDLAGFDLASTTVLLDLTKRLNEEFQKIVPSIRLVELMHTTDGSLYAVLDVYDIYSVLASLPAEIANIRLGYIRNVDIKRPEWANLPAKRDITPQPAHGIIDDTLYNTLRPGVIVCSRTLKEHAHPTWFSTTSGVMVENQAGNRFITAASHGIGTEEIWQISQGGEGRAVGQAVQEISFTDVSLVQLKQGIDFENETFENSAGQAPRFTRLFGEDRSDQRVDGKCYLNSPYTGDMDGVIIMTSVKLEASTHPTEDAMRYILYNWVYLGQEEAATDKARPPNGTCGSAIWNDDGVILGFYHYYLQDGLFAGYAATVNASEVVKAGYHLAK